VLVPKIENIEDGYKMVLCNLIKDTVVNLDDIAVFLLKYLYDNHQIALFKRYKFTTVLPYDIETLYEAIGRAIGAILRGNEVDYEKVSIILIQDFRNVKFGKISFK